MRFARQRPLGHVAVFCATFCATSCAILTADLGLAREARADTQARARLAYSVESPSLRCPSEEEVREGVAARLGYDPFTDDAPQSVVVRVGKKGRGLVGVFEIQGAKPGQREINSPGNDCRELVDTLVTAIALRLDPASLGRPSTETPPPPPPQTTPSPEPTPLSASATTPPNDHDRGAERPPSATPPLKVDLGMAAVALLGELPSFTGGLEVSVGLRIRWLSLALEGDVTLPGARSTGVAEQRISAFLLSGAFVPCAHVGMFLGCAVGRTGALSAEGSGVALPSRQTTLYGSVGARIGLEIPVQAPAAIVVALEGVAPLTRVSLDLDGREAWVVPPFAGRALVGAKAEF